MAEGASAIRSYVHARHISIEEGRVALDDLLSMDVDLVQMDGSLCRSAFEWALRLRQARAYDGFYLALAEDHGVDLWTADRRLANAARQAGAPWVHWIGEALGQI